MFLVAAETLSNAVTQEEMDCGSMYPTLQRIREVSLEIAFQIGIRIVETGQSRNASLRAGNGAPAEELKEKLRALIARQVYEPTEDVESMMKTATPSAVLSRL